MENIKKIPFKSYCWSVGTTSFRTYNLNKSIERQLFLIDKFKSTAENKDRTWKKLQQDYYYFLKENEFLIGDANRPDKDAREKTSGLVDVGLLTNERNLTEVGQALLKVSIEGNFESDNKLEISKDGYIYLKQLLKTSNDVDGKIVRPFIVFLYVESKLGYLTNDEFTYLLPLCTDRKTTDRIIENIMTYRKGEITFDEILISVFMSMDNYRLAFAELCKNPVVTEELICMIGINRKSRNYDRAYYSFYILLKKVALEKDENSIIPLFEATNKISGKSKNMWKKYLFITANLSTLKKNKFNALKDNKIFGCINVSEFNKVFFEQMHLYKVKSTLSDYFDLNRRYFKITDTVLFADSKVELDILPKCYFNIVADKLINVAFEIDEDLQKDIPIEKIDPCLAIDEKLLYKALSKTIGAEITHSSQAKKVVKDERYSRFNRLIDAMFTKEKLINLFTKFENRDDNEIRRYITDNADIPTMFEYVLGIAWYLISDRQGDILDYMNLSLEADLLPKSHAVGGDADIVYKYQKSDVYPEHTLLIEATLSEKTGQRKMEMEPVSRHLGEYMLKDTEKECYCIFISTYLSMNVISDFRMRKYTPYFSSDGLSSVDGMKIIPIQTSEIKTILSKDIKYKQMYPLVANAYDSTEGVKNWYEQEIKFKI